MQGVRERPVRPPHEGGTAKSRPGGRLFGGDGLDHRSEKASIEPCGMTKVTVRRVPASESSMAAG